MDVDSLAELSDADLLAGAKKLALDERRTTAALIAHLVEIDNRKLYLGEACGSLFIYCTRGLHLSEPAAYNRIVAARAARRFPAVLASLEQGLVHLTAVRVLAPVLTPANHRELLSAATGKSKHEVEEIVARLRPQPDVPNRIRKIPAAAAQTATATATAAAAPGPARGLFENTADPNPERTAEAHAGAARDVTGGSVAESPAKSTTERHGERAVVVPLAVERYKIQFTAGPETRDNLRRAQALLRHRIPDGDLAQVIGLALDRLVRDLEKRKFAATGQPRRNARGANAVRREPAASPSRQAPARSRHIPAEVRRAVWERDGGRCAFVSAHGERCTERGALEFDHIQPHADGGGAAEDNVRLLCRQHNQYEAHQFFGLWQSGDGHQPAARCS